jgi:glycosyltransferase involved in cell wall biosynthesis
VSAVIPSWNEELWISRLLKDLPRQRVGEVVVVDNGSIDRTRCLARQLGASVIDGGRPAHARNIGAEQTSLPILLFADADAVVDDYVIDRACQAFKEDSRLAVYSPRLAIIGGTWYERFCYRVVDGYVSLLNKVGIAQGVSTCLFVRRSSFDETGGFDENLAFGEDADLVRRLARVGGYTYDRRAIVRTSARRMRLEGRIRFSLKTTLWALARLFNLSSPFPSYLWKRYPPHLGWMDALAYGDAHELTMHLEACRD